MKKIDFYRLYKGEENGVTYNAFVSRINSGWTWEEAIKFQGKKLHREKYTAKRKVDPSRYIIDIKYKWEEAIVIASIYEDIIEDLTNKYDVTDEPQEAHDLLIKKQKIEEEYNIFLNAQI